jgi:hypothetical protein
VINNTSGGYTWEAGGIAQLLEAAYRAFPAGVLRIFLERNDHIFTPEIFREIMGQNGTEVQVKNGLYWLSSPSLEAVKAINALKDDSNVVIFGACNGIFFDEIREGVIVDKLDLFPRGGGVRFHPCDGSSYSTPGFLDCIIFPCSLPSPEHQGEVLRGAIEDVKPGGVVIVVDIFTRDEPTMDTCVKTFKWYQDNGHGKVLDEVVVTEEGLHDVRKITFVKSNMSSLSSSGAVTIPLAPVAFRKTAKAMIGIKNGDYKTGLPPIEDPPINNTAFTKVAIDTNDTSLAVAGVYALGGKVKEEVYLGSSINVCKRFRQHISGEGNKTIYESVKSLDSLPEKLAATRNALLFAMNEVPQWIWNLLFPNKGTSIDMRGFDFLLRLIETKAINIGFGLAGSTLINKHSNGWTQGVQANASANARRALELGVGAASFTARISAAVATGTITSAAEGRRTQDALHGTKFFESTAGVIASSSAIAAATNTSRTAVLLEGDQMKGSKVAQSSVGQRIIMSDDFLESNEDKYEILFLSNPPERFSFKEGAKKLDERLPQSYSTNHALKRLIEQTETGTVNPTSTSGSLTFMLLKKGAEAPQMQIVLTAQRLPSTKPEDWNALITSSPMPIGYNSDVDGKQDGVKPSKAPCCEPTDIAKKEYAAFKTTLAPWYREEKKLKVDDTVYLLYSKDNMNPIVFHEKTRLERILRLADLGTVNKYLALIEKNDISTVKKASIIIFRC